MTTPRDVITLALKDGGINGVGQTPSTEDMNDAFTRLNFMFGQWAAKRWLTYRLRDVFAISDGGPRYAIGPSNVFDTITVPNRIESAYVRLLQNYGGVNDDTDGGIGSFVIGVSAIGVSGGPGTQGFDQPLTVLQAREDFNRISMKGVLGRPLYVFLDTNFPAGWLHFWPVPTAGTYELHVAIKSEFGQFASLDADFNLPDEYLDALYLNLAVRLRIAYQMPPDPALSGLAKAALNTVMLSNTQIARLHMPAILASRGRGRFNIYGGY